MLPMDEPGVYVTRSIYCTKERAFQAWNNPEEMKLWWCPSGYVISYCAIDLRPGGASHFCMVSPEGYQTWCKGIYQEIYPNQRIITTSFFSDPAGNHKHPSELGLPDDFPTDFLLEIDFYESNGITEVSVKQYGDFHAQAAVDGATQGWMQMLDRLAVYLGSY